MLLTLALIAQALDLLSWLVFEPVELNPIVLALGPVAVLAKLILVLFLAYADFGRYRLVVLSLAIAAGFLGAYSNTP